MCFGHPSRKAIPCLTLLHAITLLFLEKLFHAIPHYSILPPSNPHECSSWSSSFTLSTLFNAILCAAPCDPTLCHMIHTIPRCSMPSHGIQYCQDCHRNRKALTPGFGISFAHDWKLWQRYPRCYLWETLLRSKADTKLTPPF